MRQKCRCLRHALLRVLPRLLLGWMLGCSLAWAAEPTELVSVDFLKEVRPILAQRCYRCHSESLHQEGNLKLDDPASILHGGDSGPAVVAGKSAESLLVAAIRGVGDRKMPPEGEPLTSDQIAKIVAWIEAGAKLPSAEELSRPTHWAYNAPVRPAVPTVPPDLNQAVFAARGPLDAFIAAQYGASGLVPIGAAPKNLLLRRVYVDLVGIPPAPEELHEFMDDRSPDAYERVVDKLLASPLYAQRWGRHWMDVWRYSDWDGYAAEVRESKPHIWRWRDWIVQSLVEDKPYDQMLREMLAGDELAPTDPSTIRATGFLVRNWYKFNRNQWLDSSVEHTGKAFLGVTFNCCRCHNHMYDPFAQKEYYQLRAFLEPHDVRTDRLPGEANIEKDGLVRIYDAQASTPTYLFRRGNEKEPQENEPLLPIVPKVLEVAMQTMEFSAAANASEPIVLPAVAYYPGLAPFIREETRAASQRAIAQAEAGVTTAQQVLVDNQPEEQALAIALAQQALKAAQQAVISLEARIAADDAVYATSPSPAAKELSLAAARTEREQALLVAEKTLLEKKLAVLKAKRALKPGDLPSEKLLADSEAAVTAAATAREAAEKAIPTESENYTRLSPVYPATSTGRRTQLAAWITAKQNPLTARVAVNHVWLRHFNSPLVPTMFDFGLNGKPASNPALLDWLASELLASDWQLKRLHRQLVCSETYRLASAVPVLAAENEVALQHNRTRDPDNRFYWRYTPHRMEAEAVRDTTLAAAGALDLRLNGADLDPALGLSNPRRSLYFRNTKEKKMTFLALFDSPNVVECYRRSESVAPQQALAMANSPLTLTQSRQIARELIAQLPPAIDGKLAHEAFLALAFEKLLCRAPTAAERQTCLAFVTQAQARFVAGSSLTPVAAGPAAQVLPSADPAIRALENLIHVLLNHNDFVTVR